MTTNHPRNGACGADGEAPQGQRNVEDGVRRHAGLKALPTDAGRPDKVGHLQASRQKFDDALRSMERFIMNLDPSRVHVLRDWPPGRRRRRAAGRIPAPSLAGLQLGGADR